MEWMTVALLSAVVGLLVKIRSLSAILTVLILTIEEYSSEKRSGELKLMVECKANEERVLKKLNSILSALELRNG